MHHRQIRCDEHEQNQKSFDFKKERFFSRFVKLNKVIWFSLF
jgi:hypothetical protein